MSSSSLQLAGWRPSSHAHEPPADWPRAAAV